MKRTTLYLAIVLSGALGGCSLIPQYERPEAPVPAAYPQGEAYPASDSKPVADVSWRDFFRDPALQKLIGIALENNRDLRTAALKVEAYRAQYGIQRADLLPTVSASAGGTRSRTPADLTSSGQVALGNDFSATLGISYELDFFGRVRSLRDQALEEYLASEEAGRTARLSLIASVANAWLTLQCDQELLKLTHVTLQAYEQSLKLTQMRFNGGVASELDVRQSRTSVESARSQEAQYQRQVAQDINALQLLLGSPVPADLQGGVAITDAAILADIPVGLPSALLLRRPDILEAEHHLKSANANIGSARAAFFPSISLTASGGSASSDLSRLFDSGQSSWSFSPQISIPIFNAGRLSNQLDYAKIQKNIQIASYEKAIQTAFREVADGLAARGTYGRQVKAERDLVETNSGYLKLADQRYQEGVDSYLTVLDAQRNLFSSQQQLIRSRFSQLSSEIALYKALGGGGWK